MGSQGIKKYKAIKCSHPSLGKSDWHHKNGGGCKDTPRVGRSKGARIREVQRHPRIERGCRAPKIEGEAKA